jgi:cardiolipin synthase
VKLIVQPDEGVAPVLLALKKAKTSIDIVVFRLDMKEVVNELGAAVARGLTVRALVAHTNRGGEKTLRKLELQMLESGVTVSRTADDLVRYHGKLLIIDGRTLHVNGFNFTELDVSRSRSFGIATSQRSVVQEALKLFQADCDRKPYISTNAQLVVSPENSRARLSAFIKGAKHQLFIYDPEATDPVIMRLLAERAKAGVDVRIIGKSSAKGDVSVQKYPGKRLHVRSIMRDGSHAFLGSQSLRRIELDRRREVGIFISQKRIVRQMVAVFESDWARTDAAAA